MLRCGPSSLSSDRQSFQKPRLRQHLGPAEWMPLRCATPCSSSAFVSSLPSTFPVRLPASASALLVLRLIDQLDKRLFFVADRSHSPTDSSHGERRYAPSYTRRRALNPKRPITTRKRLSSTPPFCHDSGWPFIIPGARPGRHCQARQPRIAERWETRLGRCTCRTDNLQLWLAVQV